MACLEHQRRAANAARLEIDDAADLEGIIGLMIDEGLRAKKTGLFAIGQQENDRPRWRLLFQEVRHFEPDADADAIVAEAGARFDAVIVGADHHGGITRLTGGRSGGEEDVLHKGATRSGSRQRLADIGGAQFRRITEGADLLHQARARLIERRRVNRMRRAVENAAQARDGALGIKLVGRIRAANGVEL